MRVSNQNIRFYIAAPLRWTSYVVDLCTDLQLLFPQCTLPSWPFNDPGYSSGPNDSKANEAMLDIGEVAAADVVIVIGRDGSKGGRFAELGAALALGKKIYAIGDKASVFCHHPSVTWIDDITDLWLRLTPMNYWHGADELFCRLKTVKAKSVQDFVTMISDRMQRVQDAPLTECDEFTLDQAIRPSVLTWLNVRDKMPTVGQWVLIARPSGYTHGGDEFLTAQWDPSYKGWVDVGNKRLSDSGLEPAFWAELPYSPVAVQRANDPSRGL